MKQIKTGLNVIEVKTSFEHRNIPFQCFFCFKSFQSFHNLNFILKTSFHDCQALCPSNVLHLFCKLWNSLLDALFIFWLNPNGWGGVWLCLHFFRQLFFHEKRGIGGPKFRYFSNFLWTLRKSKKICFSHCSGVI